MEFILLTICNFAAKSMNLAMESVDLKKLKSGKMNGEGKYLVEVGNVCRSGGLNPGPPDYESGAPTR